MRVIGNNYLRDEFKRHKQVEKGYLIPFFIEWSKYKDDLVSQINNKTIGKKLDQRHIEGLSDVQLGQLFSLYEATGRKAGSEEEKT